MNNNFMMTLSVMSVLTCSAFAQDVKPAYDLVGRVMPQAVKQVEFQLDKSVDGFRLENKKGKLLVKAPCVNNLTAGYGFFLTSLLTFRKTLTISASDFSQALQ